jgi:benzoyl-CoA 2,3-epoxidase subunit A
MTAAAISTAVRKQHLIDPEICIRCNTCEATCPVGAVTHDDRNYVVDADKCNFCMDCIAPCPTDSIDNWRMVAEPYALEAQFGWEELPAQQDFDVVADPDAMEGEAGALLHAAHAGGGGRAVAPASASKPVVNLYTRARPAIATVQGNFRITSSDTGSDVRHIVLSFGATVFPVLEGQSIGILPPGTREDGRPHDMRLYSIASSRDGEKRNANNVALTVKRNEGGLCSNYLCDLRVGDQVSVVGPYGATFLMPNDPNADILMVCTGTGSAPFRAFTERRRRAAPGAGGRLLMYFGARAPEELPYFGPLQKVPRSLLEKELVFSRLPSRPKEHVQDRMRTRSQELGDFLRGGKAHVYVCGLKGMETGVDAAFSAICDQNGLDWAALKPQMRAQGRYHVETY